MSLHDDLVAARALIANPENWGREHLAMDKLGIPVETFSSEATCFCALGAISRVVNQEGVSDRYYLARLAIEKQVEAIGHDLGVAGFNDDPRTTHEKILGVFDQAIEQAKLDEEQKE